MRAFSLTGSPVLTPSHVTGFTWKPLKVGCHFILLQSQLLSGEALRSHSALVKSLFISSASGTEVYHKMQHTLQLDTTPEQLFLARNCLSVVIPIHPGSGKPTKSPTTVIFTWVDHWMYEVAVSHFGFYAFQLLFLVTTFSPFLLLFCGILTGNRRPGVMPNQEGKV